MRNTIGSRGEAIVGIWTPTGRETKEHLQYTLWGFC
jgi:hypothetical protein